MRRRDRRVARVIKRRVIYYTSEAAGDWMSPKVSAYAVRVVATMPKDGQVGDGFGQPDCPQKKAVPPRRQDLRRRRDFGGRGRRE